MDDVVKEFVVESAESLDQLDRDLVSLEKDPASKDLLAGVFRAIHNIKGTTGFLGYRKLEGVAHAGESLLSRLRDGIVVLNPSMTSGLLLMVDAAREMLASIEATGSDGEEEYSALIETLTRLENPEAATNLAAKRSAGLQPGISTFDSELAPLGQILVESGRATEEQVARALAEQSRGDRRPLGEILVGRGAVPAEDVLEALRTQRDGRSAALSVRVHVDQLDKLMSLAGELALARNQILQLSNSHGDPALVSAARRLNRITTELEESVIKTRMQPIENIWSRFPRVVRDLAMACDKRVRLEMEGRETELDKTVIEAIKDPLTHLVRNSIDHGIELPGARVAAGKTAEGLIVLRASQEGGEVSIEIWDDGAGVNVALVKRKAVELGLIAPHQASGMSEREALNLVFAPGLSTAERVTNVSGRGVGMDVVKTNIEKMGGVVGVESVAGSGTTIKIRVPSTLANVCEYRVDCGQ